MSQRPAFALTCERSSTGVRERSNDAVGDLLVKAWLCAVVLLMPSIAAGQPRASRFVAARVGANLVGNTYRVRQEAPTAGAGVSAGLLLSPYWATELELWVPRTSPAWCTGR